MAVGRGEGSGPAPKGTVPSRPEPRGRGGGGGSRDIRTGPRQRGEGEGGPEAPERRLGGSAWYGSEAAMADPSEDEETGQPMFYAFEQPLIRESRETDALAESPPPARATGVGGSGVSGRAVRARVRWPKDAGAGA